jgi:hypothetical protein
MVINLRCANVPLGCSRTPRQTLEFGVENPKNEIGQLLAPLGVFSETGDYTDRYVGRLQLFRGVTVSVLE